MRPEPSEPVQATRIGLNEGRAGDRIDWTRIHRRLQESQLALERRLAPGGEERQRILRTRASLLAKEDRDTDRPSESLHVVEFLLTYEHYAIESTHIREIYPLKALTSLPCTPSFVAGLVNVRGQILSVIDLKKFFDLPAKGLTDLNKVIILRSDRMELGILADAVLGVRSLPVNLLQPSLPTLKDIRAEYLRGVATDPLIVLDTEKILSDGRLIIHEGAMEPTGRKA